MRIIPTFSCLLLACINAVYITPSLAVDQDCRGKVDILILMDSSNSINKIGWGRQQGFFVDLVGGFDYRNVRFALITFSSGVVLRGQFKDYSSQAEVQNAISNTIQLKQNTNTSGAFDVVRAVGIFEERNGDRPGVPNIILLCTDGRPDDAEAAYEAARKVERETGALIYAIGVGSVNDEVLSKLASAPQYKYSVRSFGAIYDIKEQLKESVCQTTPPPPTAAPPPPPTTAARPVPIPPAPDSTPPPPPPPTTTEAPPQPQPEPDTTITTPPPAPPPPTTTEPPTPAPTSTEPPTPAPTSTEPPTPAPTSTEPPTPAPTTTEPPTPAPTTTEPPPTKPPCIKDNTCLNIFFVVDSSGSIGYANYQQNKPFLRNVIAALAKFSLRVGIIYFGTNAYVARSPTTDLAKVNEAINTLAYRNSSTHTDKGITAAQAWAETHTDCPTLTVVNTDGLSTYPEKTTQAAATSKGKGSIIAAFGIGEADQAELKRIASPGLVFNVRDYSELANTAEYITTIINCK